MTLPRARTSPRASRLALLAVGLSGCAGEYGLADETYPVEPVAILEGELRGRISGRQGPTAMTLAWAPDLASLEQLASLLRTGEPSCGAEEEALLQPMAFQPHFPSSFVLPLSTTPAPVAQHALEPLGGKGRMALGWVVSFQDGNRNGVLDRAPPGGAPELVVATSLDAGLALLFLDGALPPERTGTWREWPGELPQGFSILGVRRSEEGTPSLVALPDSTSLSLEASRRACP